MSTDTNQTSTNLPVAQAGMRAFSDFLKSREKAIGAICAGHIKPERLTRVVLACVTRTPLLQQCTMTSILRSVMQSAELGLECGSAIGEAYLVPFKNNQKGVYEAQLIIGYRGYNALMHRSGEVSSAYAREVYEGDDLEFEFGLNPTLRHVPAGENDPQKLTHAYAVISLKDGGKVFDVMTRKEIDRIRARSRASSSGPWVTDFAEMAKKTVFRRGVKYAPMSIEMGKALAIDDAVDTGDTSGLNELDVIDAEYEEKPAEDQAKAERSTGVDAVKAKINGKPGNGEAKPVGNPRLATMGELIKALGLDRKAADALLHETFPDLPKNARESALNEGQMIVYIARLRKMLTAELAHRLNISNTRVREIATEHFPHAGIDRVAVDGVNAPSLNDEDWPVFFEMLNAEVAQDEPEQATETAATGPSEAAESEAEDAGDGQMALV